MDFDQYISCWMVYNEPLALENIEDESSFIFLFYVCMFMKSQLKVKSRPGLEKKTFKKRSHTKIHFVKKIALNMLKYF